MAKQKQNLWTKFGGKEFFARMAENAKNDGEGNEISKTYATKDVATTSADGLLSKTDKAKLDNIAAGAQVNAINTISANGTALTIDAGKNVDIPLADQNTDGLLSHEKEPLIPAAPQPGADRVYSFDDTNGTSWQAIVKDYVGNMVLDQQGNPVTGENGAITYEEGSVRLWLSYKGTEFGARRAYDDHTGANIHDSIEARTTLAQVTAAIESALANYGGFKVVDTLVDGHPDVQDPSERFIYLYKDPQGPEADPYTEWIYTVDNEWDVIGTTYVDLSPYYTSAEVESRLATKVDKVTGKGLSTEDYTTDDKNKLTGIETGAEVNLIESVKVDGTALPVDANKAVDIPLASVTESGNATVYVTGVVSGQDKAKWDNWVSDEFPIIPKPNIVVIGGRAYPTVKIGNQMWMAENLDYTWTGLTLNSLSVSPTDPHANYYNGDQETYGYAGLKYGLLYNYPAAKYLDDNKSTMLPDGWHVPTSAEFTTLINTLGSSAGTKLKSVTGWNSGAGDNSSGFNALPVGRFSGPGTYDFGSTTSFQSTTENGSNYGYTLYLNSNSSADVSSSNKYYQYSIRLVKNLA